MSRVNFFPLSSRPTKSFPLPLYTFSACFSYFFSWVRDLINRITRGLMKSDLQSCSLLPRFSVLVLYRSFSRSRLYFSGIFLPDSRGSPLFQCAQYVKTEIFTGNTFPPVRPSSPRRCHHDIRGAQQISYSTRSVLAYTENAKRKNI